MELGGFTNPNTLKSTETCTYMGSNVITKYWQYFFVSTVPILILLDSFIEYPRFLEYKTHLLLHIVGVVLFLGNIVITAIWMRLAELSKNQEVIEFAVKVTNRMDIFMTAPGAFLILINGLIMAEFWGGVFEVGWVRDSVSVFILSAVIWVFFLVPIQKKLIEQRIQNFDLISIKTLLRKWYFFGIVATLLPIAVLYLMVVKPVY